MTISELFAAGGLTLLGVIIAVLAIGIIAGAGLGYFSASTDLKREKAKAWYEGERSTIDYIKRREAAKPGELVIEYMNPYRMKRVSGGDVGAHVHRIPGNPAPIHVTLYDQDAPTEAAKAIELRGDD